MNFSQEELLALRLREYVAAHPEAQQKLAAILAIAISVAFVVGKVFAKTFHFMHEEPWLAYSTVRMIRHVPLEVVVALVGGILLTWIVFEWVRASRAEQR